MYNKELVQPNKKFESQTNIFRDNRIADCVLSISISIIKDKNKDLSRNLFPITEAAIRNRLKETPLCEELTPYVKKIARFIHYIANKYEDAKNLNSSFLENVLGNEYIEYFAPEILTETTISPFCYFTALILTLIVSLLISIYIDTDFVFRVIIFFLTGLVAYPFALWISRLCEPKEEDTNPEEVEIENSIDDETEETDFNAINFDTVKRIVLPLLTSLLFLIGLADLPYWYYTLLKLVTCAVCAYSAVKTKREWIRWIFGVLAVLYNPVLPVHLNDKTVWSAINFATAAFMWLTLYIETKKQ